MERESMVPVRVQGREGTADGRGVVAFLVIAFGLAWLPYLTIPLGVGGPGPILMPLAPAIACFVVRKWVTREGFGDAGLGLALRHWPLYIVAVVWPLAANLLSVLLTLALPGAPSGFTAPWGLAAPSPLSLLTWLFGSIVLAPIIFGEEFGWRGYLQVRLLPHNPLLAATATGLIWGIWHYPLILAGGEISNDRLLALILFPVNTTIIAVFLGWLRLRSGSVWPGSVAHAGNNLTADSLNRLSFTGKEDGILTRGSMASSLLAEALLVMALLVGHHMWRRKRTADPSGVFSSTQHTVA